MWIKISRITESQHFGRRKNTRWIFLFSFLQILDKHGAYYYNRKLESVDGRIRRHTLSGASCLETRRQILEEVRKTIFLCANTPRISSWFVSHVIAWLIANNTIKNYKKHQVDITTEVQGTIYCWRPSGYLCPRCISKLQYIKTKWKMQSIFWHNELNSGVTIKRI